MSDEHGTGAHRVAKLIANCYATNIHLAVLAEAKRPGVIGAHFDSRAEVLGENHALVEGA